METALAGLLRIWMPRPYAKGACLCHRAKKKAGEPAFS
jgi:hypothetical protein